MQDTKRWSIRGVPIEMVDGFRTVAFEAGCPIAELLEEAFDLWWDECVTEDDESGETEEELQHWG